MCGRVFIGSDINTLLSNFAFASGEGVQALGNQFPRYNGGPGVSYPVIIMDIDRNNNTRAVFISAKWGIKPSWWKPGGPPPPINSRSDTIKQKFKSSYTQRRCLVPINGFFEWKDIYGNKKNKQPYAIALKSGAPFCLAGIWAVGRDTEGLEERTFSIVTCEPNSMMAQIHDRMPVILHPQDYDRWLGGDPDPEDLMKPFPSELMTMWPVGRNVGNVRNQSADLIDPIDLDEGGSDDDEPTLL